ncbi:radical SAM protein [Candidatus Bathyarchaeota archaeon]|nr:MAG: radical SAM protein [Candidatus Bathyarchaeota archaeon]
MWYMIRPDSLAVLKDKKVRRSLNRYFKVMEGETPPKFKIARKLPVDYKEDLPTEKLWEIHHTSLEEYVKLESRIDSKTVRLEDLETPKKSFLDLKSTIARRILESCHLCSRRCGVNRLKGERGYCGCGNQILVSTIFAHMGEEPELVPSGTIFTLGCTLRCLHCQNWSISQWYERGVTYTPKDLAAEIDRLKREGCRNVNLVGGEPTPWLEQWLQTFKYVNADIPVVWNSNSYYSKETAELLAGFADVYLLDFKYGSGDCAKRISDAPNYWDVCTRNHLEAFKYGELIIRVLVLPGHLECCVKEILEWIADNLGKEVRVNVMFQYRPEWRAHEVPELRRRLTRSEMDRAVELARKAGLTNFIT